MSTLALILLVLPDILATDNRLATGLNAKSVESDATSLVAPKPVANNIDRAPAALVSLVTINVEAVAAYEADSEDPPPPFNA
jgi:hypothetical protein